MGRGVGWLVHPGSWSRSGLSVRESAAGGQECFLFLKVTEFFFFLKKFKKFEGQLLKYALNWCKFH